MNETRIWFSDLNWKAQEGVKEIVRERVLDDEEQVDELKDLAEEQGHNFDDIVTEAVMDQIARNWSCRALF